MARFTMAVTVAMAASLLLLLTSPATQVTAPAVPRPRPKPYAPSNPYGRRPSRPYVRPTPTVRPTPNVGPNPWVRPPNSYIPPINPNVHPITPVLPPKKPINYQSVVRTIIKKAAKHYLKDKAKQAMRNVSSSSSSSSSQEEQDRSQLRGDAADAGAAALVLGLSVGSQVVYGVIDITSDLVWMQCGYCPSCHRLTPAGTPTIVLEASPSFLGIGCATPYCEHVVTGGRANCDAATGNLCTYEEVFYGGDQYTSGFLAIETFTFGAMVRRVVFGCSGDVAVGGLDGGASGFLGFSRGPLSLVAQLQLYGFSYFISSGDSSSSQSSFALSTAPMQQPAMHSTPLIPATAKQNPQLYYVNLIGVQVDGELLTAIPAGTFDGDGGVYLSTTLPVTYLEEAGYRVLKQELVSRIQSQGVAPVSGVDLDDPLCYMTRSLLEDIKVPHLALVFHGADATMDLRTENYFLAVDGGQTCLTILPSTGGSVLGSLLQAGRTIAYTGIQGGGGWLSFN